MALTGTQIKAAKLGETTNLVNGTSYTPSLIWVVVVGYKYTIPAPPPGDDGKREARFRLDLTQADFASLSAATRNELIAFVEGKISG